MPTTARQIARPYNATTCRINTRGQRISRQTLIEWACIFVGGALCSWLLTIAINAASAMLAGR
jgi:hypothetical protein